jgi:N-formylmaleamate deformylase
MKNKFLYGAHIAGNRIRQHYLRYGGNGPTVVVIPGITSPAITWDFVAEELADDYDVYVVDVRGRGLSSTGESLDYSLNSYADDIAAFVKNLDLADVRFMGHSMGARILIRAIARGLGQASRALLVDPPVSGPGRRAYPAKLSWYVDSIRLAEQGISIEGMKEFCPTWSEAHLRVRAEWLHTCYLPAVVRTFEDFHLDDIHSDLPMLKLPTLLLVAGNGGVIQAEDEDEICRIVPGIAVQRIDGAGHMIPWDDLPSFLSAIRRFL